MIVYTGGTFDLFHSGHVNFLKQCWFFANMIEGYAYPTGRELEREVVVSLNTDEFIKSFKGRAPVYSYDERKKLLLGCRWVTKVVSNRGGADSKPAIMDVKPHVIAIGSDWAQKDYYKQMGFTQKWLDEQNIILMYLPYTEGVSTTELKRRILDE